MKPAVEAKDVKVARVLHYLGEPSFHLFYLYFAPDLMLAAFRDEQIFCHAFQDD